MYLDLCVFGACQVAANGDIANRSRDAGDILPAIGGAMDLAEGAQGIWVLMSHTEKTGARLRFAPKVATLEDMADR